VAGDMSQGATLVGRAIQNGKETAAGVEAYLRRRREDRGVV
jgi:NADPH-dependent glutamate synthase beta subunit-like oxidoreductase